MRRLISILTNRLVIVGLFLLLQIALIVWFILEFASRWYYLHLTSMIIGFMISLYLISDDKNPIFKMTWIIFILIIPVFGVLLYIYSRTESLSMSSSSRMREVQKKRQELLSHEISYPSDEYFKQQKYLMNLNFPVYKNTKSIFLPSGKIKQQHLLEKLKKAEKFIFMEYFIITKSKMWDEILDVLIEKQQQGVEIRIMYDDFGSATKLPYHYHKKLEKLGMKVVRFNPMKLHLNFSMNYRDHRKIVVIDNKIAFTGGINIGDEYTNKKKVFGYWHDAGIMIEGEAVWSFTALFLENWIYSTKKEEKIENYHIKHSVHGNYQYIPFGDIPVDKSLTARSIYLHLINDAKKSIYITAPYLILDTEISSALKLAAESGVDVNIIIPAIPDKRLVYMVSESYVQELIPYGVKIYKFSPGFIHSKMIICDEKVAMIGTSNLDFRSLYMHLENNLWLNDPNTIKDMSEYFRETLNYSKQITKEAIKKRNIIYRVFQAVLRTFSPLL